MKKWLNKARLALLSSLPIVVFFTYFPLIKLGASSSMNFEISLPMIWLAIFDLVSLAELKNIYLLFKNHTKLLLSACILSFWLVLSCFWSPNPLRGILTAGLVLAIFYAILSIFADLPNKKFFVRELKIFLGTSFAVSVFCILQGFLDVFGFQDNLMCTGCHYQTLGFPHSNGFTIEPQFMGNLLIAPCVLSLDILYKKIKSEKGKGWPFAFAGFTFVQLVALFICFSRGAIYSFVIASLLIAAHGIYHKRYMRAVIYITTIIISFCAGLLMQGIWAEISPTSEGFFEGVSRSISQLTLGKVEPKAKSSTTERGCYPVTEKNRLLYPGKDYYCVYDDYSLSYNWESEAEKAAMLNSETEEEKSDFDGYIEESTNVRLELNRQAFRTWQQKPTTMLFGVGLGGAGRAMQDVGEKEIVQNEFISLLLEIGLVGWALIIITAFWIIKTYDHKTAFVFIAIILAYLLSMNFYSGITNVWHIYLFTPVLYLLPGIRNAKTHMLK